MSFKSRLGDRRQALRFEIIGQLWGAVETVARLRLLNLTRGGALVEASAPPNAETFRSVLLGLDGSDHQIAVRVRHVTPERTADGEKYLVGLQFVDPSDATMAAIGRVLEARIAELHAAPEA